MGNDDNAKSKIQHKFSRFMYYKTVLFPVIFMGIFSILGVIYVTQQVSTLKDQSEEMVKTSVEAQKLYANMNSIIDEMHRDCALYCAVQDVDEQTELYDAIAKEDSDMQEALSLLSASIGNYPGDAQSLYDNASASYTNFHSSVMSVCRKMKLEDNSSGKMNSGILLTFDSMNESSKEIRTALESLSASNDQRNLTLQKEQTNRFNACIAIAIGIVVLIVFLWIRVIKGIAPLRF